MALVMQIESDPDASLTVAVGFLGFTLALTALTITLYRRLSIAAVSAHQRRARS